MKRDLKEKNIRKKKVIVIRTGCSDKKLYKADCTQHGGHCCASGYCCNK